MPCFRAFIRERALPSVDCGPRLLLPLRRLISARSGWVVWTVIGLSPRGGRLAGLRCSGRGPPGCFMIPAVYRIMPAPDGGARNSGDHPRSSGVSLANTRDITLAMRIRTWLRTSPTQERGSGPIESPVAGEVAESSATSAPDGRGRADLPRPAPGRSRPADPTGRRPPGGTCGAAGPARARARFVG